MRAKLAVVIVAVAATVFYVLIALGSFRGFSLGMDLGIFDQAVRAYAHFQTPYIQMKAQGGFNILGDHFSPIIALLAPFYWIWPDARMLMCAQAVLFGFSVGFVGWYAWRRGLGWAAVVVAGGLAGSFGVLAAAVFDFHEIAFGLPVLVWALWAFLEHRDGQLIAACLVMCLVKEDMPMYAAGIGLALFVTGRRLFGLIMAVASVAVTLLLVLVVIPHFNYAGHYAYIGAGSRGLGSIGDALNMLLAHLASGTGVSFLLLIIVTAGLGVRRPIMLAVLPTILFRLMATDTVYLGFRYQYGVLLTGVCIMAVIDGWAALDDRRGQWVATLKTAQVGLLLLGAVAGVFASGATQRVGMLRGMDDVLADKAAVQALIPDGANVAADVYLVPQIVDRTLVQQVYPDFVDETGVPVRADYVFLDTETIAYNNWDDQWTKQLIDRLTGPDGGYELVDQTGRFVLLERTG